MAQIGIDVGGSGLRAARVEDGRCGEIHSLALDSRSVESVLAGALSLAKQCGPYSSIGVAVPGFADGGIICSSPNFPQWRDVPFGTLLAERADCPVHVENDASAAAWGAYLQRGAREDLVLLTLGTGVGGGVVSGGQLLRGASGCAAEIGHMYVGGDRLCGTALMLGMTVLIPHCAASCACAAGSAVSQSHSSAAPACSAASRNTSSRRTWCASMPWHLQIQCSRVGAAAQPHTAQ